MISPMPDDFRHLYEGFDDELKRKRVICDFISGMTDRYAVEFYGRIFSENPQSIFKEF
jgi:dGTPase